MKNYPQGFSFIELLVVITVTMTLLGFLVANYGSFQRKQEVKQAMLTFKTNLRLAQTKASAGQHPTSAACTNFQGFLVSFPNLTSYTIGPVCDEGSSYTEEKTTVTLPSGVSFSTLPSSFTYRPLTHGISLTQDLTVTFTDGTTTAAVKISTVSGVISE